MPDLKTTLTALIADLGMTIQAIDTADADVKKAIESDLAFFTCVQARNTALQGAITEKVRRNRSGWLCEGTVKVLEHVADELVDAQARALMKPDQRVAASKLSERADSLAVDAKALADKLNQTQA